VVAADMVVPLAETEQPEKETMVLERLPERTTQVLEVAEKEPQERPVVQLIQYRVMEATGSSQALQEQRFTMLAVAQAIGRHSIVARRDKEARPMEQT